MRLILEVSALRSIKRHDLVHIDAEQALLGPISSTCEGVSSLSRAKHSVFHP